MLNKDWWVKNLGGIFLTTFTAIALYAASAYITTAVASQMKGYVPLTMWNQWAQERGEWRGKLDNQVGTLEKEQQRIRSDIQGKLSDLDKKQDVQAARMESKMDNQTALLNEMREALKSHMSDRKP